MMGDLSLRTAEKNKYFAQRFGMWLAMVSMFMMFAGWTSAYLVRRTQSDWLQFDLPIQFVISTIVIIASSFTMMFANHYYKIDNYKNFRTFLGLTLLFGVAFLGLQYSGWQELQHRGIYLGFKNSNPSGSFLYLISGAHALHVLGGILFLLVAYIRSWFVFKSPARVLIREIAPSKGIRMDLLSTYWHFVDVLWLYLYLFFIINK